MCGGEWGGADTQPTEIKLRVDFDLTCYARGGIDAIQAAIEAGCALSHAPLPFTITLVAPPSFALEMVTTDRDAAGTRIREVLTVIAATAQRHGANMDVKAPFNLDASAVAAAAAAQPTAVVRPPLLTAAAATAVPALDSLEIMQGQATLNIGTIGHVAHGKSTIVRALTGVHTQRFKAELESNKTLRLGYANAKIYKCCGYQSTGSKDKAPMCDQCGAVMILQRHVSFVDCPGHDSLMGIMLDGAAIMDAALLLVRDLDVPLVICFTCLDGLTFVECVGVSCASVRVMSSRLRATNRSHNRKRKNT
jgi:hypothetical protein